MTQLIEYFNRQSNAANWPLQDQLCGSDGAPLWLDIPNELVISLVARGRDNVPYTLATTDDGTDQLIADDDGMIYVNILPTTLGALEQGMYDIWLVILTDGFAIERVYGRLPLHEGIGSMSGLVGAAGGLVGKAWVWQLKYGLKDEGYYDLVEAEIPSATNDKANIAWTTGGKSQIGDSLYLIIQSVTGWSTSTMAIFYTTCSALTL